MHGLSGLVRERIKHHGIKTASGRGLRLSWYVSADIYFLSHFWPSGITTAPHFHYFIPFFNQNRLVIASGGGAVDASGLVDRVGRRGFGILLVHSTCMGSGLDEIEGVGVAGM